jgi:hypothetical protein
MKLKRVLTIAGSDSARALGEDLEPKSISSYNAIFQ